MRRVVVATLVAACGPRTQAEELDAIADRMCRCVDQACIDREDAARGVIMNPLVAKSPDWMLITHDIRVAVGAVDRCRRTADRAATNATMLRGMKSLRDRMCACADRACIDAIQNSNAFAPFEHLPEGEAVAKDAAFLAMFEPINVEYAHCGARFR